MALAEIPPADLQSTSIIEHLRLHKITIEFGEAGLLERMQTEIDNTDWDTDAKDFVHAALAVAIDAHDGHMRGPQYPYSTHILRVAIRLLSNDHFAIRDQPDLIAAALLHDSVEDRPRELLAALGCSEHELTHFDRLDRRDGQLYALDRIEYYFGSTVRQYVESVTNKPSNLSHTREEKYSVYHEHVRRLLVEEPLAGIIKLSDLIDNTAGLKYNEKSSEEKKNLAMKYYPLIPDLVQFVEKSTLFVAVREDLLAQLTRCKAICIEYNPSLAPVA